jgi:hypothetical protein
LPVMFPGKTRSRTEIADCIDDPRGEREGQHEGEWSSHRAPTSCLLCPVGGGSR